jgi:hypothetical protein
MEVCSGSRCSRFLLHTEYEPGRLKKGAKSYRHDQQDITVWGNLLFHFSLTAQHVSIDIISHHHELLNFN